MYQITNSSLAKKCSKADKKDMSSKHQYLNLVFREHFFTTTLKIPFGSPALVAGWVRASYQHVQGYGLDPR